MKNILTAVFLFLAALSLEAQALLNLTYSKETKTYTVSILPQRSWPAPLNKVGSAQLVLRVPTSNNFIPVITSRVPGVLWSDNSYVENAQSAPGFTFISIAMVNGPTDNIQFVEGQETPLFSFVSATGACPEKIELPANDDPLVQAVVAEGFNVTQHIALLGLRGNAYAGIGTGLIDCAGQTTTTGETALTDIQDISLAPVPADEQLTVSWTQLQTDAGRTELLVYNTLGQEVFREEVSGAAGSHSHVLQVKNWKSGLYRLHFQTSTGRRSPAQNLMVLH